MRGYGSDRLKGAGAMRGMLPMQEPGLEMQIKPSRQPHESHDVAAMMCRRDVKALA